MTKVDPKNLWLDMVALSHSGSKKSRYNYNLHFDRFLRYIGASSEEILSDYDKMDEKLFKRKYAQIIIGFLGREPERKHLKSSDGNALQAIKSFFKYNSLPLNYIPPIKRVTFFHNRDIQKEEIEEIIRNSQPREKAYYALMAQSGLRPNEISNLKVEDFENLPGNTPIPCMITIKQEITKGQYKPYFTFAGQESIEYIKDYFKREDREIKEGSYVFTQSDKQSPTNSDLISHLFRRTVNRLRREKVLNFKTIKSDQTDTEVNELRLYNLRKYFRNHAGEAGQDFVNSWMGHSLGIDEHYFSRYDTETHRKKYAEKAMPQLRIQEKTPSEKEQTMNKLETELEEYKKKYTDLEQKFQELITTDLTTKINDALRAGIMKDIYKEEIEELRKERIANEEVEKRINELIDKRFKQMGLSDKTT